MATQSTQCRTEPAPHGWNFAILGKLRSKITDALERYRAYREACIAREAFRNMLTLDDDILDDIGVTRNNVEWASQLPIHLSAAQALEKTRKRARPKIRP